MRGQTLQKQLPEMKKKIAFIGGGNMAAALVHGLIADGANPQNITVAEPDPERRAALSAGTGIRTCADNREAADTADILILAVKPQVLETVCAALQDSPALHNALIISVAAGIRHDSLQKWLGAQATIVRSMPNTPAMIQCGATVLYAGNNVSEAQRNDAEHIVRAVGLVRWVDNEALMDAVTAVSGSGPAYFFLIMEAMEAAAQELGLPAETAHLLTLQTALGSARMAMESADDPATLRRKVTSPGGTTEQAINRMENAGLRDIFKQALSAARDRSVELSELLGGK